MREQHLDHLSLAAGWDVGVGGGDIAGKVASLASDQEAEISFLTRRLDIARCALR